MRSFGESWRTSPPEPISQVRMDPALDVVMGHEFCAEVVELGPDCSNVKVGDTVVSMPVAFDPGGLHAVGYSNAFPGGYGELMLLSDLVAMKVPNGLDHRDAALTEPLAVGIHAVVKSKIAPGDAAVVLGCGPVMAFAVIDDLRRRGIEPIVASDFSPARRALAPRWVRARSRRSRGRATDGRLARVDGVRPGILRPWACPG
jgi:threonine dehydrogenase-like Zn-dependent dehydrogenase